MLMMERKRVKNRNEKEDDDNLLIPAQFFDFLKNEKIIYKKI